MPDKFLNEIDQVANNENRSRSELIREALRQYMKSNNMNFNIGILTALK
jgi:metal-responsive CopG/Arc/MetJ family transcriptional regulator